MSLIQFNFDLFSSAGLRKGARGLDGWLFVSVVEEGGARPEPFGPEAPAQACLAALPRSLILGKDRSKTAAESASRMRRHADFIFAALASLGSRENDLTANLAADQASRRQAFDPCIDSGWLMMMAPQIPFHVQWERA